MRPDGDRLPVSLLGASGIVGQRFIQRLTEHPWFEMVAVAGSERTVGRSVRSNPWLLDEPAPEVPDLTVLPMLTDRLIERFTESGVRIVFSALPSDIARTVEPVLASAGLAVLSNASAHRHSADVPLVIADLNPHHLLILRTTEGAPERGYIACSTNCTVVPIALPLKPLWDMLGFSAVRVRTEQALSGGGRRLLESAEAADEVPSSIPGEAEKVTAELRRVLGRATADGNNPANIEVEVECRRVMRRHGHLVHVEVELDRMVALEELLEWWSGPTPRAQTLGLPSAPDPPLRFIERPLQPDSDRWAGARPRRDESDDPDPATDLQAGMAVTISSIEVDGSTLRFSALADNTLRGAAGGCVLLAEMLHAEGLLPEVGRGD